jgi:hypothetical protein
MIASFTVRVALFVVVAIGYSATLRAQDNAVLPATAEAPLTAAGPRVKFVEHETAVGDRVVQRVSQSNTADHRRDGRCRGTRGSGARRVPNGAEAIA